MPDPLRAALARQGGCRVAGPRDRSARRVRAALKRPPTIATGVIGQRERRMSRVMVSRNCLGLVFGAIAALSSLPLSANRLDSVTSAGIFDIEKRMHAVFGEMVDTYGG